MCGVCMNHMVEREEEGARVCHMEEREEEWARVRARERERARARKEGEDEREKERERGPRDPRRRQQLLRSRSPSASDVCGA